MRSAADAGAACKRLRGEEDSELARRLPRDEHQPPAPH